MSSKVSKVQRQGRVQNRSTVRKVVDYIEDQIKCGNLYAGSRLPTEPELCSLLNVSRTSVREAIKIMSALSIVHVRRGDGTYISQPEEISVYSSLMFKMLLNGTTWDELCEFRELMEFSTLRCAILHATAEDIAALRSLNDELITCHEENPSEYEKLLQLDKRFHTRIAKATHNKMMEEIYEYSFEVFSPIILGNYKAGQGIQPTIESHSICCDAIEKRDLILAGHATHISVELWREWAKKQESPCYQMHV